MACASSCVQKMTFCTYGCIRNHGASNRLDDVKTLKDFPFTGEGLDESLEWISQEFEERKDYWMQMEKDKMKMIL